MIAFLAASVFALAVTGPAAEHDHSPKLGRVVFQSSCKAEANALVERGLGWLHSFEYEEAERSFADAAIADPGCGIAFWGVAMSNYHPLWAAPSSAELEKGRKALASARAANAGSRRERDYVEAIAAFFEDSDRLDHKTRALAYSSAMARLRQRYPEDREAAVFYALSLVAAGTLDDDPGFGREREASAILDEVLKDEPDHPGVAHYLIHSFDYPPLAHLALPAARRYASIAPASAHAQHMPSHIFTRLGLWEEAIESNLAAEAAAQAYARAKAMPGSWDERLHTMDYLVYAYLQAGRDAEAQHVLDELKSIERVDPANFKVAYAATAIPARILLERRRWAEAAAFELPRSVGSLAPLAKFRWAEANVHFAKAVGAARTNNLALAREEVATLAEIERSLAVPPGEYDWRKQVSIQRQIAQAWVALAMGRKGEAAQLMRAAADLDDATEKHPVTPGSIVLAREQLGELLIELGLPGEALAEFEASLTRAPQRLAGLYGAARAAKLAGDSAKASLYYAEIVEVTRRSDGKQAEIIEARSVVAGLAER